LQKIKEDSNFISKLIDESTSVFDNAKYLINSFPKHKLSLKETEELIMEYLGWNVEFAMVAIFSHAVESIKEQTDLKIKRQWEGTENQLADFLNSVYVQTKAPLSNIEQRDILKLSKLEGQELELALKKHFYKYRHIIVRNLDENSFDIKYYKDRLKLLQNELEYQKTKKELQAVNYEIEISNKILDKSNIADDLKEKIRLVKWFMYYQTEGADYHKIINGTYKPVIISIADRFDLTIDMVMQMTYTEIINSLKKNKLSISKDSIADIPLRPSHSAAKRSSADSAKAVIQPRPVITTRRFFMLNFFAIPGFWI